MSQSKQALRTRIKSVNSTKKITRAMEMIANAKLFKQRNKMESNREYAKRLQETVDEIVAKNPKLDNQYMKPNTSDKAYWIVIGSDLGLCGGYNQNVVKFAQAHIHEDDSVYVIGTNMYKAMQTAGFSLINQGPDSSDMLEYMHLKEIVMDAVKAYKNAEVGVVQILYTRFVNTMTFTPDTDVLLPCSLNVKEEKSDSHVETLFEPDANSILDELIPMMLQDVAYSDWMESTTSEQGSRRVAMKTATDNAEDLGNSLLLEYNKARQAAITQEITEIVGGSQAV